VNLTIRRGNDEVLKVTIVDANGVIQNLTGAALHFMAKRSLNDADDRAVLDISGAGIDIPLPANGIAFIKLPAVVTADLTPGSYDYDVQMIDSAGKVSTPVSGLLTVEGDVVRAIT